VNNFCFLLHHCCKKENRQAKSIAPEKAQHFEIRRNILGSYNGEQSPLRGFNNTRGLFSAVFHRSCFNSKVTTLAVFSNVQACDICRSISVKSVIAFSIFI